MSSHSAVVEVDAADSESGFSIFRTNESKEQDQSTTIACDVFRIQ